MEGLFNATVLRNEFAARGTRWITLHIGDDRPLEVAAGNIVALTLSGGVRRPYTVSRARVDRREIDLLVRVVEGGRVSPELAATTPGHPLTVQGTWGRPIRDLIHPDARSIIGIATGTGVGPLIGFAAEAQLPMTLVAGFRTSADICVDELPRGVRLHLTLSQPSRTWVGERGRSTASAPAALDDLGGAHVHLVGNGEMVSTWAEALRRSGVPVAAVTSEVYFNKNTPLDEEAVQRLAGLLSRRCAA